MNTCIEFNFSLCTPFQQLPKKWREFCKSLHDCKYLYFTFIFKWKKNLVWKIISSLNHQVLVLKILKYFWFSIFGCDLFIIHCLRLPLYHSILNVMTQYTLFCMFKEIKCTGKLFNLEKYSLYFWKTLLVKKYFLCSWPSSYSLMKLMLIGYLRSWFGAVDP